MAYAGSIPGMASCDRCHALHVIVGRTEVPVPACPWCRVQLGVVTGELPITLDCSLCRRSFYLDVPGRQLHPRASPFPMQPMPHCMQCQGGLGISETLPPRGECSACNIRYQLAPLRPLAPCTGCGGPVISSEDVMPPEGRCERCARTVSLGTSYAPIPWPNIEPPTRTELQGRSIDKPPEAELSWLVRAPSWVHVTLSMGAAAIMLAIVLLLKFLLELK